MECDYVLLTGATGQVGRYLLKELLSRGRKVAVLIRRHSGASPQDRLMDLLNELRETEDDTAFNAVCLEGDTTLNGYGLCSVDQAWVKQHCYMLLHCAARVGFSSQQAGEILRSNVESARHTIKLCQQSIIEHVAYVSTAYVCGRRSGIIYEDELDAGQAFRNEYERSKFEAEMALRQALDPSTLTVLRPAIVVGDFSSGKTYSFHGFYRVAQFTNLLAEASRQNGTDVWSHNVRVLTSAQSHLNLVPVDWLGTAIAEIVLCPNNLGKTYHLAPKVPTKLADIEAAMRQYFRYDGVRFIETDDQLSNGSNEESRFYEYVKEYVEYLQKDPRFDRTNTDRATHHIFEPIVDVACLLRLIDFAVKCRFGKLRRKRNVREA